METIIAILILLIGAAIGFAVGRMSKSSDSNAEAEIAKAKMEEQQRSWQRAMTEKDAVCNRLLAEKEKSFIEAFKHQETNNREALNALQIRFDETVAKMQLQIQNTTARMLRERQEEFQMTSSASVANILSPLKDTIAEMKKAVAANTQQHNEFSGMFSANIEQLLKQSEAARTSADRLANALSHNTKVQGEWGETILTELLEAQGLKEGRHFHTQAILEGGTNLRPDVILHLDRQRDVIIDSKVSLSAYLSYINAECEEEKNNALKAHVASIENHVKELVRKDYSHLVKPPHSSIGYVIMFVPNTTALLLATTAKPDLWRKAMEQNIYIADEQTLYAALKIVHLTWTQIAQNENHKEVFDLANEMLHRVGKFMEKYVAIGNSIDSLKKDYDEGLKKIKDDGHSIPQTCRKLIKMGARMDRQKNVPDNLLGLINDKEDEI